MSANTEFEKRLLIAVASLRSGEVVSFGDMAAAAGKPEAPRAVGRFLSQAMEKIPWWRVVYADGRLPPCDVPRQKLLLESENVEFKDQRVSASPLGRFKSSKVGPKTVTRKSEY